VGSGQSTQSCWAYPKATESFVNGLSSRIQASDGRFRVFNNPYGLEVGRRFARYATPATKDGTPTVRGVLPCWISSLDRMALTQADRLMTLRSEALTNKIFRKLKLV